MYLTIYVSNNSLVALSAIYWPRQFSCRIKCNLLAQDNQFTGNKM